MRYGASVVAALFMAFVAGGCGGEANPVPDVEGKQLDVAQELLDDAGLGYEVIGGGDLGVIVRRNWEVCEQRPRPGKRAKSVELHVGRSCIGNVPDNFDYDYDDYYDEDDDDG